MTKVVSDQLSIVSAPGQVQMIALADLRVAEWNARKTIDLEVLKSFIETVQQHGIQVPLTVRPLPMSEWHKLSDSVDIGDGKEIYEIVAGHRRFKAAAILKLAKLPCIVRELDDVAAREVGLIDNLQRENVPPLEEADGLADLMDQLGSIAAVAARVGKEQGYVAKSLKLRTLTTWSRDALGEKLITIDHALLLARLAEAEQNEALKWCLDRNAGVKSPVEKVLQARLQQGTKNANQYLGRVWEPETVQKLKEHIEDKSGTPLARAPWLLDDDSCGPVCSECPKNTKANAPLFSDLDIGEPTCTDRACFTEKTAGFVRIQARTSEGMQAPLRVSWKATSKEPRMEIGEPCDGPIGLNNFTRVPNPAQIFKAGQWVEATKNCPHARQAVTIDWSDANDRGNMGSGRDLRLPGEILRVCVQPKCKVHPKAYETTARANSGGGNQESWEERRAREEKALEAYRAKELPVRRAVYDAIVAKMAPLQMRRQALLEELNPAPLCYGLGSHTDDWKENDRAAKAVVQKAKDSELDVLFFHSAFGDQLRIGTDESRKNDKGRGKLRELAKLAGVDAAAIERKFDAPIKNKVAEKAMVEAVAKMAKKAAAKKAAAKKAAKKGGAA